MVAQIGWIDFSEKDRKKALDVIHLLQEQGAVDELGFGKIRDAFANYFFPGTSTVQTRAKYFFIIPYAMMEVCANTKITSIERIIQSVDQKERECASKMGDNDGVIGRDMVKINKWVIRKPSNIYWNGLKKLGIFTYPNYSTNEYYREELERRKHKTKESGNRSGEENEQDDETATANGEKSFWNLPPEHLNDTDWLKNLTIDLHPWEARWMRKCISENLGGSLFKLIVDNDIDIEKYSFHASTDNFKTLSEDISNYADEETKQMMTLANRFNSLVYLCRILYNQILFDGSNNQAANDLWKSEYNDARLTDINVLNIDELFSKLTITNAGKLRTFIEKMKEYLSNRNIDAAKECIIEREIYLKREKRAKLLRKSDFNNQPWVGGYLLDYRFGAAARLIKDIYEAETEQNNIICSTTKETD